MDELLATYKFFRVVRCPLEPGRKTHVYQVENLLSGDPLGCIRWYSNWRQFTFMPLDMTVFSVGCLRDIQDAIAKADAERQSNG